MEKLNQKKFAIASGITSVIVYLGCSLMLNVLGRGSLVKLSNLLFHGMDFNNIIRTNITIGETILGAFAFFLLWGVVGYVLAFIYNIMK